MFSCLRSACMISGSPGLQENCYRLDGPSDNQALCRSHLWQCMFLMSRDEITGHVSAAAADVGAAMAAVRAVPARGLSWNALITAEQAQAAAVKAQRAARYADQQIARDRQAAAAAAHRAAGAAEARKTAAEAAAELLQEEEAEAARAAQRSKQQVAKKAAKKARKKLRQQVLPQAWS